MTFSPSLVVDIVFAIVAIFVIIKYSIKGFLKTVLDIVRLAVSIVLAITFRGFVADLINSLFMTNAINNWVGKSVTEYLNGVDSKINFVNIYNTNPEFYSKVLTNFGLDFNELEQTMSNLSEETKEVATRMIAEPLANMFSTLIAVIAIFIVSMIVLYFIVKLINQITKIKGINFINKLLGVVFGVVLAIIIIWALSLLLEVLIGTLGAMLPNIFNEDLTNNSMIISLLRDIGLLDILENLKTQITGSI